MNGDEQNSARADDGDERRQPPPVVLGPMELDESSPAEETPRPTPLPYRRTIVVDPNPSSRELLLGWCLWLLGSWILLGMGFQRTPVRRMIFASMMGMMFLWPAFRLSQDGRRRWFGRLAPSQDAASPLDAASTKPAVPARSVLTPGLIFRDWFALNSVFQAVIWPHVLTEQWPVEQAAWVSLSIAVWSLLVGGITALGCMTTRMWGRVAAMAAIVLLVFAEPVVLAWVNRIGESGRLHGYDWAMHVSPIEAIYALTTRPVDFDPRPWMIPVGCVAITALAVWTLLIIAARAQRSVGRTVPPAATSP